MDLIIECPACKAAFRINRAQGRAPVKCPSCQWKFDASQAKRRKAEADAPIPKSESIDRPTAAVTNPFEAIAQTPGSSGDDQANPKAIKPVKTKRTVRPRKRKSPWPAILVLLGLTVLVALLGGWVVYVRQKQSERAALQKEDEERAALQKDNEERVEPAPPAPTPSRRPIADASESTDPIRISEPDDFSPEMAIPELDLTPVERETVPVDPIPRLRETLDQYGELCEAFQFLPEDDLQYEQLQTFALQLSLAKAFLADDQEGEMDSEDRTALTERSVHWLQTMKALVTQAAADAPERLPQINAFAKLEFDKGGSFDKVNRQIIFYGLVFLRDEEKPNSILKLDRKQVYYSVPEFEGTSDESYRVFFVETAETPSQKRMHSPGGGLIKVSSARLIYSFDPIGELKL